MVAEKTTEVLCGQTNKQTDKQTERQTNKHDPNAIPSPSAKVKICTHRLNTLRALTGTDFGHHKETTQIYKQYIR